MGIATLGRARAAAARATSTQPPPTSLPPEPGVAETVAALAPAVPAEDVFPDERPPSVGLPATVPKTSTAVALPDDFDPSCFEGEWSSRDSVTKWLQVLGPKSPAALEPKFRDMLGHFIYDKDYPMGPELKVIVIGMQKYYREVTGYNSEVKGRRFRTSDEVRAAELDPGNREQVKEEVDVQMLVKATTDEMAEWCSIVNEEGEGFVPAQITARSWSLGYFIKPVRTDYTQGWLRGDTKQGYYTLTTSRQNIDTKGNYTFSIKAKPAGKLTPEFYAQVKALVAH